MMLALTVRAGPSTYIAKNVSLWST